MPATVSLRTVGVAFTRRAWRPGHALIACLLPCQLLLGAAQAAPEAGSNAAATSSQARAWLARVQGAAQNLSFQGTLVVNAAGSLSSLRVWHQGSGDMRYAKREALDGRKQLVLRRNEEVQTRWPQERVIITEQRQLLPMARVTPTSVDPRALEYYSLQRQGDDRVADRDVEVVLLNPRDELRYPQRLWADRATGLLLRAEILDAQLDVLESASFSVIELGIRTQPGVAEREWRRTEGWRVIPSSKRLTELDAEGWTLRKEVPGFRLLGCVKRPLAAAAAAADDAGRSDSLALDAQVLQAVFSDGLTHVSVFIEPFHEPRHRASGEWLTGATGTLTQRRGDQWITVMGDVPAPTLRLFADSLARR